MTVLAPPVVPSLEAAISTLAPSVTRKAQAASVSSNTSYLEPPAPSQIHLPHRVTLSTCGRLVLIAARSSPATAWWRWITQARTPRLIHVASGTIRLNKKEKTPLRLAQVYAELIARITQYEAGLHRHRGGLLLRQRQVRAEAGPGAPRGDASCSATCGLTVAEYAPLSIKSSVTGYGLAAKEQVQFMVTRLLALDSPRRLARRRRRAGHRHLPHPHRADAAAARSEPLRRIHRNAISATLVLPLLLCGGTLRAQRSSETAADVTFAFRSGLQVPRFILTVDQMAGGPTRATKLRLRFAAFWRSLRPWPLNKGMALQSNNTKDLRTGRRTRPFQYCVCIEGEERGGYRHKNAHLYCSRNHAFLHL